MIDNQFSRMLQIISSNSSNCKWSSNHSLEYTLLIRFARTSWEISYLSTSHLNGTFHNAPQLLSDEMYNLNVYIRSVCIILFKLCFQIVFIILLNHKVAAPLMSFKFHLIVELSRCLGASKWNWFSIANCCCNMYLKKQSC